MKNRKNNWIKIVIQLLSFILIPELFVTGFTAIGDIFSQIYAGSISWESVRYSVYVLIATVPGSVLVGRFFCGFFCSFGAVQDFLWFATRGNGNGDVILHMTPEMILDYLGILVDTTKVPDLTFTANLILPEGNYVLRVKNGVLLYQKDTQDADADVTWTTKRAGLLSIIQKNTENIAALIQQEGDETCLTRLMDAVTVTSEYKYFNIIEP